MKTLEIRRHAQRRKPGMNLTTEGIRRARRTSACERDFALVVSSTLPRAVQTAVAMGHGVDEEEPQLASMGIALERFPWDSGFEAMQRAIQSEVGARAYADLHATHFRAWMERLESGSSMLVVSHGGVAELGILGLLGDRLNGHALGASLDYCEGVRLMFDGTDLRRIEALRFVDGLERQDVAIDVGAAHDV